MAWRGTTHAGLTAAAVHYPKMQVEVTDRDELESTSPTGDLQDQRSATVTVHGKCRTMLTLSTSSRGRFQTRSQ